MRNLLMTTALAAPLLFGPAFAQQTPAEQPTDATQEQQQQQPPAADPASDPGATDPTDEPDADDPAAPAEPGPAGQPPATDAPADDDADDDAETADAPADAPPAADVPAAVVDRMEPNELRGDWIIGTSVTSPGDETIGTIQDLIVDAETGQVTAAVLGVGGFLGIGAKNIAVDWNQLQIDYDGREITLDMTREQADAAPDFEFRERA
jgi:sporulation protein YlmC with PRC-barrel domain